MAFQYFLQARIQVWKLSVLTVKWRDNHKALSSFTWPFGYHQAGIKRPVLNSLETVWDRAAFLQPFCAVWRLSHPCTDVSTGIMYQFLVAMLSLVYTALSVALRIWAQLACSYPASPSRLLTLWHCTSYVCVSLIGGSASDQSCGSSVESQWTQSANKNRRWYAVLGRLNICWDNILCWASVKGGWCCLNLRVPR